MKTGLMSYTQTRMSTGRTSDIQGETSGLLSFILQESGRSISDKPHSTGTAYLLFFLI